MGHPSAPVGKALLGEKEATVIERQEEAAGHYLAFLKS
jgi:hypothetical protein